MRITKNPFVRSAIVLSLLVGVLVLAIPQFASAESITGIMATAIGTMISVILYFLNYVAVILFSFAGMLTSFFLDLNYQVLADSNRIITVGWGICRDIANLGLVLLLVIIAIATIVRFKDYAAKTALPKLIAAALIVNFSFAITQVFIDFSHSITRYFFQSVSSTGGIVDTVEMISGAFNPQRLLADPPDPVPTDPTEMTGGDSLTAGALVQVSSLAFSLIFTLIAAFTLIAFAFSLLARYLHLTFLVILSPLAWLFWAFPGLSGQSGKWWSNFLKWVFFAPIASFFTYLALTAVRGMGSLAPSGGNFVTGGGGALASIISQGAQMFLMAGLLLGGLMMGQSLGIAGASGGMKMFNSGMGAVKGWAGAKTKGGAMSLRNRAVTSGTDENGKTRLERLSAKYGKIPLVGRAFTGLSGVSSNAKAEMAKNAEKKAKDLGNLTKEDLVIRANRLGVGASQETIAAHMLATAEAGGVDDLSPEMMNRGIRALQQTNSGDKILGYVPQLATQFEGKKMLKTGKTDPRTGKDIEVQETDAQYRSRLVADREKIVSAAVRKNVKDAGDLADSALKDPAVLRALASRHITQLADIEIEDKVQIKTTLESGVTDQYGTKLMTEIQKKRAEVGEALKDIDDAKTEGNDTEKKRLLILRKGLESDLKALTESLTTEGKEALRVRDTMADNAGWNDTFPGGSGKKK